MEDKTLQELSEVIQSSNINVLMGAGASTPFLPLLGNIEQALNNSKNINEKIVKYKDYLEQVIIPNKKVINEDLTSDANFNQTKSAYITFFNRLTDLLIKRKSTILSKQINIFTTNIDLLMEKFLEEINIEYNDGFCGKFEPSFSLANFKKASFQRSLHFDHISEIPVFNLIKIHGSITWKNNKTMDKIIFSPSLDHIEEKIGGLSGAKFLDAYKKLLVVNPEETKHLESVLNIYYSELLRLYSSELEKENATLFILGFSMEDKHIREITLRSAKSNPTLRIFVCCSKKSLKSMKTKFETDQHPNIQMFTTESDSEKFTLDYFNEHILDKVSWKGKKSNEDKE